MSILLKVAADIAAEQRMKKTAEELAKNIRRVLAEQALREGRELPSSALTGVSTVEGDSAHIRLGHKVGRRPTGGSAETR